MTTVEALQAELDGDPSNQVLRLALADALLDDGDERGLGLAALARQGLWPFRDDSCNDWWFHDGNRSYYIDIGQHQYAVLPADWHSEADVCGGRFCARSTRRELELYVAAAFLLLPADRQQQLLEPQPCKT